MCSFNDCAGGRVVRRCVEQHLCDVKASGFDKRSAKRDMSVTATTVADMAAIVRQKRRIDSMPEASDPDNLVVRANEPSMRAGHTAVPKVAAALFIQEALNIRVEAVPRGRVE